MPSPDLLEDLLALLYATNDEQRKTSSNENFTCHQCGSEMEFDEEGAMRCPDCDEELIP